MRRIGVGRDRFDRPCLDAGPVRLAWERYPGLAVWRWGGLVWRLFVEVQR